ncbi:MAG: PAS domain S-box protein [Chloroflexi bacterium]|nr:PAS domain S-box protein [Chloroflexota bacterium]
MSPENLHTQLNQYIEQQRVLLTVTRQVAASAGLGEIIPHILEGVGRAIEADGARLVLTGVERQRAVYSSGPLAEAMAPADAGVIALAEKHGDLEISRGADNAAQYDLAFLPPEISTLIAIRLVAHETAHGILWLGFRSAHAFDEAERTFLSILVGQAAIATANARSFSAARKRREWLAAVLASTPDAVLVVDRELNLQLVNSAAQEMFPTLSQDVIGLPLGELEQMKMLVEMFRAENGTLAQVMLEYQAENGRVYAPKISDVRTENGEMTGWVLVLRDISPFKRLNQNMSEFLSTVSHDMRSPLTFMKGFQDMLGMVGPLNEKQREFVEKTISGVDQMADMVEKILEAGKLDPVTGNYQLAREPVDMVEIFNKVINNLSEPAAKKGLTLTYTCAPDIPVLNVDRAMLTSAFTNLVENAVKYTPEGGQVEIELASKDGGLLFRVKDNGFGISAEDQKKLFARNVRIHRKEWKRVKGSGLGLFIVKNVAQRHGGDAWVESSEGKGSTFFISLPFEGANLLGGQSSASD